MQPCVAMFSQNGQGQENLGSGGRLRGLSDQFEKKMPLEAIFMQPGIIMDFSCRYSKGLGLPEFSRSHFEQVRCDDGGYRCCRILGILYLQGWTGAGVHRVMGRGA